MLLYAIIALFSVASAITWEEPCPPCAEPQAFRKQRIVRAPPDCFCGRVYPLLKHCRHHICKEGLELSDRVDFSPNGYVKNGGGILDFPCSSCLKSPPKHGSFNASDVRFEKCFPCPDGYERGFYGAEREAVVVEGQWAMLCHACIKMEPRVNNLILQVNFY